MLGGEPSSCTFLFIATIVILRWAVSTFPYSGQNVAPMFGDYEAQRHWQELTVNLPAHTWYKNTTDNDLLYWGLDYPPLTAYHSWIIGKIGEKLNSSWVELHSSRGTESMQHKLFMRYSVLCSDLLVYIPSVIFYASSYPDKTYWKILTGLFAYPGLILIDYGHFQYNCVSLGFFILAVAWLEKRAVLQGAVAFSLALNYKQMELYHAMPFFVYILASCLSSGGSYIDRVGKIAKVAVVVLATFAACWAPFLNSQDTIKSVLLRLFPFSRGLFEDKVSNFWCALNVVYKIRKYIAQPQIVSLCAMTTLLSITPASVKLFMQPTARNFKYTLVISSLAFFLFSYQVHEKSILIAAISCLLLIDEMPVFTSWFAIVSIFSMLPLLLKDGLSLATLGTTGSFLSVMIWLDREAYSLTSTMQLSLSGVGMAVLAICGMFVTPPSRLPDLWPVLISLYSCAHFVLFYFYLNYHLMTAKFKLTNKKST
ncbi:dolichyl pyrophosphate Man9GlcNAc2 alpha-1,3-glucosyltransferase-like [Watersipora subatra]|uniref:dolichyl pyrophosphate Man9GlcNAc2 alpha-1,3-glucosyltransferase-like n=1 Tax=Watersipora subatra TaxID=2589382 RepID=UPI00355ACF08